MTAGGPVVETEAGRVRGLAVSSVLAFRGIPYAAPPLGHLRFRPPQATSPWRGVRDAVDYGPIAVQETPVSPRGAASLTGLYDRDARQDEDCLRLNIWAPAIDGAKRPVLVWIHGGSFSVGTGRGPWTDGASFARTHDVVVVSLNHRLQGFGFLSLDAYGAEFIGSGNAGMLDIVAALRWLRDNISGFGGDPDLVTLFGQSGGGWKICTLLAMPAARGLFQRAIIQSGTHLRAVPAERARQTAKRVLSELGICEREVARIREVPAAHLRAATSRAWPPSEPARIFADGTLTWNFDFAPVVDGTILPTDPFHPGASPHAAGVPLLVGTNRDESDPLASRLVLPDLADAVEKAVRLGMARETAGRIVDVYRSECRDRTHDQLFAELLTDTLFWMPATRVLEAKLRQGSDAVYAYLFCWGWPSAGFRAIHGIEAPIVFGNLLPDVIGAANPVATRALSAAMGAAWAAFARSGDPNHPGVPEWPVYTTTDRAAMVFDHVCRVERDPRAARRRALSVNG